jgi:hypothetical protein
MLAASARRIMAPGARLISPTPKGVPAPRTVVPSVLVAVLCVDGHTVRLTTPSVPKVLAALPKMRLPLPALISEPPLTAPSRMT